MSIYRAESVDLLTGTLRVDENEKQLANELSNMKGYIQNMMRWSFEAKKAMENIVFWHMEYKKDAESEDGDEGSGMK